jgi:hypothetical protein
MANRESKSARRELLFALGHPLRQGILEETAVVAELSPKACSDRLRKPLTNVSYHFRVLADCKAVVLVRTKPARGSVQHFYRFAIEEPWVWEALGLTPPQSSGN